jgi:hypothetical protein
MGTNSEKRNDTTGKTPFFRAPKLSRPASFMVRWHALQHELKTTRIDSFLKEISQIVARPRRLSTRTRGTLTRFQKSLLSNSLAS